MADNTERSPEQLLEHAFGALQPFYSESDDGSSIRLSLNAIAGLLADDAGTPTNPDLTATLHGLRAKKSLTESIKKLYEAAVGGEYGAGLGEDQARQVNGLVEEVYDPLREFVLKRLRPKRKPTRKARRKTRRSS